MPSLVNRAESSVKENYVKLTRLYVSVNMPRSILTNFHFLMQTHQNKFQHFIFYSMVPLEGLFGLIMTSSIAE